MILDGKGLSRQNEITLKEKVSTLQKNMVKNQPLESF